jgi:hypothetical protein
MRWCCDFPLANGSCPQGFDINVQAGTVLEDDTTSTGNSGSSGNPTSSDDCEASHDIAVGLGVGIPTLIACVSMFLLYLRERRARRKEKLTPESLNNDETPWIKHRADGRSATTITSDVPPWIKHKAEGRSVTTITSDEPPWITNRVEAYAGPSVPRIELDELSWRRELP